MNLRNFSFERASRLFAGACDVLIPTGLLMILGVQMRLLTLGRSAFEAIGRSVLLLLVVFAVLHIGLLFRARRGALAGLARSFIYLLLLMTIFIIRIS